MSNSFLKLTFALGVVLGLHFSAAPTASAIPPFKKEFDEIYPDQKVDCNVCHVKGEGKKVRNAYGFELDKLLDKDNFKKERLEAEPEKTKQEIQDAIKKVGEMKPAGSDKSWDEIIKEGKNPIEIVPEIPATPEEGTPDPMPMPMDKEPGEGEPMKTPADSDAVTAAKAKIESAGGSVFRVAQNSSDLDVAFHLSSQEVTDAAIAPVAELPGVVSLNLRGTKITDGALAHVAKLNSLQKLHLEKTGVTDAGLKLIGGLPNLTYLNLYGTEITDAGLENLYGLKNLKSVYLFESKVTDEGANKLKEAIPGLQVIR